MIDDVATSVRNATVLPGVLVNKLREGYQGFLRN